MSWYAVRTVPGSQKPQREFVVETTRSVKGYRIVPSLNANVSAIERALTERGFTHYMPAEKRLVRDRLKTDLWKVRRFALMVGYVFVKTPANVLVLERETPGVIGVVGINGTPLTIEIEDILMLRAIEAKAEFRFDIESRTARQIMRKKAKTDPKLQALVDSLDITGTITMPLDSELLVA